jgi:hypothetical protein
MTPTNTFAAGHLEKIAAKHISTPSTKEEL